ncbi:YcgN family cysteine cluster protein [Pseudaeromonas sp. ZJS20]|uniref:YcgN family cysteine cluster protein n=1 Tax=Pseudaeromonas aegiceratis TaxID=3153928 RepID=UPI00390C530E
MQTEELPFWQRLSLAQMSQAQWESLCDGCGKCCLHKLIDDETEELHFTNIACDLLDLRTCQCKDYPHRFKKVPDCTRLTPELIDEFHWLPASCAYRRLAEGQPLPDWHPLITGSRSAMHAAGASVRGKAIHERHAGDWEDHIVTWPL